MTIILFLIILGALIFVHELGHFICAKKAGIRVDEFALGFPPKIFSKKIGETVYSLNLVPFGGYVKIFGEDGEEDTEQTRKGEHGTDAESSPPFQGGDRGVVESLLTKGVHDTTLPAEDGGTPFIKGDSARAGVVSPLPKVAGVVSPLIKGVAHSDEPGVVSSSGDSRRFTSKSKWVQAGVLVSGVLGNLVFAWFLISFGFFTGIPSSVEGRYAGEVRDGALTITSVLPDSPADKAGFVAGDVIVALQEDERRFEGIDGESARAFIGETDGELSVTYRRAGEERLAKVAPVEGIVAGKRAIGVSLDTVGVVRFGAFRSFFEGALMTADLTRETTVGLFRFIKDAFLGQADFGSIAGPVGIAGLVGEARTLGLVYLISFTAFISINLAVINLLPIPALDGGRLLFLAIEGVSRRPIPVKIAKALNTAGFVLLILLMVAITYRDIVKMI